ncbi:hypothetical protein AVEN_86565-1 [Araneus ventricosus]|uniref:Kazal-like domain-containing protein n=1 Tax=Araneus ventricosus TaxID=182803 RepID=A0A4Y2E831_ARAVE|nr:hypothetical protein AVEN_15212-1 [Araneus ventricosus]GBM23938.1 hypothetical protein AVEN_16192-1 [Araneus ventricosus]GBM24014.1 hypothetical protein AVEN_67670-1 [Araneus ventricosus]GBM24040.1 hypothetical protein AVEN_86565-1 [Araneus ventricosus]
MEMAFLFHADLKDPCEEKECHFGAQCQPSLDGRTAECICPEKCATYGDSRSRPVCGTDGKDYPNVCELRRTSCLEMREIEVRYKGHCGMEAFVNLNYKVGHSRAFHARKMAWWHSTHFHFLAHPFRQVIYDS